MNKFAEKVKEFRIEKNMTRQDLAEKLSVSVRLISYWENGKRECDFDMLIKLATLFDVTIDELIGKE